MTTTVKWTNRHGDVFTGELHSFVYTPSLGAMGVIITPTSGETLGFELVESFRLEVVDIHVTQMFKASKKKQKT